MLSLKRFNPRVIGSVESGPMERQSVITVRWGLCQRICFFMKEEQEETMMTTICLRVCSH